MKKTDFRMVANLILQGTSRRVIAQQYHVSPKTITKVTQFISKNRITIDVLQDITDLELTEQLSPSKKYNTKSAKPDYDTLLPTIVNDSATKRSLWESYCDKCNISGLKALSYSRFCSVINDSKNMISISEDASLNPGDLMILQYLPFSVQLVDSETGEISKAYVIFAYMAYSQKSLVYACRDKKCSSVSETLDKCLKEFGASPKEVYLINCNHAFKRDGNLQDEVIRIMEHYGMAYGSEPSPLIISECKHAMGEATDIINQDIFFSRGDLQISLDRWKNDFNSALIGSGETRNSIYERFE